MLVILASDLTGKLDKEDFKKYHEKIVCSIICSVLYIV